MKQSLFIALLCLPLLALAEGEPVDKSRMLGLYGTPYNAPGKWVCQKTTAQLVAKLDRCKTSETAAGTAYACSALNSKNSGEMRDGDYYFFKSRSACQANLDFLEVD